MNLEAGVGIGLRTPKFLNELAAYIQQLEYYSSSFRHKKRSNVRSAIANDVLATAEVLWAAAPRLSATGPAITVIGPRFATGNAPSALTLH